jgi:hypothetical protein
MMTATITGSVCIDLPEGLIEAEAEYEPETGALVSACIAGRAVPSEAIAAFVGPVEWARIEFLPAALLADLCADAAREYADGLADYRYEQMRDER